MANSATRTLGLDLIQESVEITSRRISQGSCYFLWKASIFDAAEPSIPEAAAMVYSLALLELGFDYTLIQSLEESFMMV